MLRDSATWPITRENELALCTAETRVFRWMCGVKLTDRLPSSEMTTLWKY